MILEQHNGHDPTPGSQEQARLFVKGLARMCCELKEADAFGLYLLRMALDHFNGIAQAGDADDDANAVAHAISKALPRRS